MSAARPPGRGSAGRPPRPTHASRRAGSLGGAVFRHVKPGPLPRASKASAVLSALGAAPRRSSTAGIPASGYGYLTTRDGTELAIDVHLRAARARTRRWSSTGLGYANPDGRELIGAIANLLGYAVVDVNMRGTGCSGGAFDFFEPLQGLDGYDVIDRRAPAVGGAPQVGMMGVSYGGISQLFVAATRPPSLAAIAPLSVIDDTATTLYPGGILNTGFALSWAKDRVHDAKPASATGGQAWALERIRGGDPICKANQALHAEAVDLLGAVRANRHYVPKVADPLAPVRSCTRSASRLPRLPVDRRADGRALRDAPAALHRHLAQVVHVHQRHAHRLARPRHVRALVTSSSSTWRTAPPQLSDRGARRRAGIFSTADGGPGGDAARRPDPGPADYAAARAAFEALPPVRILFDNGAGSGDAGCSRPRLRALLRAPPAAGDARAPGTSRRAVRSPTPRRPGGRRRLHLEPDGASPTNFTGNTSAGPNGCGRRRRVPVVAGPAGTALAYVTAPLTADTAVVGAGALAAWIRSSAPQRRSPGHGLGGPARRPGDVRAERLAARERTQTRRTAQPLLEPVLSLRRKDAAPLPKGRWAKVTVPLYYQGHVYRAGRACASRSPRRGATSPVALRRAPAAPPRVGAGLARALAAVATDPACRRGARRADRAAPCPGLRGEPCRPYTG